MKFGQNFRILKSQKNTKMGLVVSKIRSLDQILEKPCVCSRDQIFRLILMKLGQSVCPDEILYIFLKWVVSGKKVGH